MNKAELIDAIAQEAKMTKSDAKKALDAFVDATSKALKKGDRVALVGFGSFSCKTCCKKRQKPSNRKRN